MRTNKYTKANTKSQYNRPRQDKFRKLVNITIQVKAFLVILLL
jgi:hypothetical protein